MIPLTADQPRKHMEIPFKIKIKLKTENTELITGKLCASLLN